jgi:hypothetical protein
MFDSKIGLIIAQRPRAEKVHCAPELKEIFIFDYLQSQNTTASPPSLTAENSNPGSTLINQLRERDLTFPSLSMPQLSFSGIYQARNLEISSYQHDGR